MTKRQTPPASLDSETGQLAEAEWLARYVQTDGGGDLVQGIRDLIRTGRLQTGARLPTVRMLAPLLGVSPATVAGAWSRLRDLGMIETRRRGGTVVIDIGPRVAGSSGAPDTQSWDLAQGLIDYALLPDLRQALVAGLDEPSVHRASKEHAVPSLVAAVAPTWPFRPHAWSTAGSGTEGTLLAIQAVAGEGGAVAIESPTSPRLLDICTTLGVELIAVECDGHGPTPGSLREALARRPAAFVYQPRAQVPLGHAVDAARLAELARELQQSPDTQIVEDDFIGPLSLVNAPSMGALLPERTLLVRGYCNTYGIDLRTCVVGGSSSLIDRMRRLRSFGAAMNSRILQGALAWLINDERTSAAVARARQRYASRRTMLLELLQARGFAVQGADGLNLWVRVPSEETAIVSLAAHGISVGSGQRCHVGPRTGEFLRVSTARLPDSRAELEHIANCFAEVQRAQRSDGMILGHE
ncbi:aminotransferase class I/II-fold pyridoxal phosphate-dependent enzyme [Paraburkholderia lycopersici]|uniref:DNA-binding transcriptional regulator, MocR family, contains an aminotransferase domain n=1 Tax=Paraburkholderia lycopersici TaxID=416944 RepID=A0A1G6QC68_9BURK|nr:PLP-dependent aminotransferase family protein [Paraburkholderia lycopersici]SDC89286.1 DNA-binding transcriptional regulator, MocR family, contains an aminotransferase domain [Paraburkholderia lycopersici]